MSPLFKVERFIFTEKRDILNQRSVYNIRNAQTNQGESNFRLPLIFLLCIQ
jgi:hypothetical protein